MTNVCSWRGMMGAAAIAAALLVGAARGGAQLEMGARADAWRTNFLAAKNFAGADSAAMPALASLRARLDAPASSAPR